jgi:hypothetical protein
MTRAHDSDSKRPPGWAEHTVVANLPRRFPGAAALHAPLSAVAEPRTLIGMPRPVPPVESQVELGRSLADVEEPRTVVGEVPSFATAQRLIARYEALSSSPPTQSQQDCPAFVLPLEKSWFRRLASFAKSDFQRAPRIVRLLLPALPLVAAATTFLDAEPQSPAFARAVAVAAAASPAVPNPRPLSVLPASTVTIVPQSGQTLASEAADAAALGNRAKAIAIYAQLAREHPEVAAYASAARILMRLEERDRPRQGP